MRCSFAPFGHLALLAVIACGCSARPPAAPNEPRASVAPGEEAYASVDDAEKGLKRAEAEFRAAVRAPRAEASPMGGGREERPPAAETAPAPPPPAAGPPPRPADASGADVAAACPTACRAFASMTRATETICRLAGPTDERCTRAQRSVDDARSNLRTCVCVSTP
jgi:hypothetical protein